MSSGYLYIAYGDEHVKEALFSLSSLRKADKKANVTIVSDRVVPGFDNCIVKECKPGFSGKVDHLSCDYYDNTLFLDTDTYVCEDPSSLFNLSNRIDVAIMLDPAEPELEPGFAAYNTGVMLLRQNTTVQTFLRIFRSTYHDAEFQKVLLKGHPAEAYHTDQPSFAVAARDAVLLRIHSLPSVWNARYRFNISLMGSVKIIHGPTTDFKSLQARMNSSLGNRIWKGERV